MRYEYNRLHVGESSLGDLNKLGAQGWRLVLEVERIFYFIREIPEVGAKLPEPQVRATA